MWQKKTYRRSVTVPFKETDNVVKIPDSDELYRRSHWQRANNMMGLK